VDRENNDVGEDKQGKEEADKEEGLEELADGKPVILVILVEVLFVEILDERRVVEDNHVGDQRWLESVIKVGDQPEIVDGHEADQLEVFNEDPDRQESNATDGQNNELDYNKCNYHPIHVLGDTSERAHDLVVEVKDHLETDLGGLVA
jgi:hypothetical protein